MAASPGDHLGVLTTKSAPVFSMYDQSPTDDPNLAQQFVSIVGENRSESTETIGVEISRISTTQRVDGQHVMSVHQDQDEDVHTEYDLTSIIIGNSDHDPNLTELIQQDVGPPITTEFYSDPKDVAYLLRPYPAFIGLVAGKFIWEKQTLLFTANPFTILSIVAYALAYLILVILSCIYDQAKNSPHQHLSPGHYMIPKYSFYILCLLAHSLLVPMLFIPHQ